MFLVKINCSKTIQLEEMVLWDFLNLNIHYKTKQKIIEYLKSFNYLHLNFPYTQQKKLLLNTSRAYNTIVHYYFHDLNPNFYISLI